MDTRITHWIMTSKRSGVCIETGNKIEEGDTILFIPVGKGLQGKMTSQVFCESSDEFKKAEKNPARTGYKR